MKQKFGSLRRVVMFEALSLVGIAIIIAELVKIEINSKKIRKFSKLTLQFQMGAFVDSSLPTPTKDRMKEFLKKEGFTDEEAEDLLKV